MDKKCSAEDTKSIVIKAIDEANTIYKSNTIYKHVIVRVETYYEIDICSVGYVTDSELKDYIYEYLRIKHYMDDKSLTIDIIKQDEGGLRRIYEHSYS